MLEELQKYFSGLADKVRVTLGCSIIHLSCIGTGQKETSCFYAFMPSLKVITWNKTGLFYLETLHSFFKIHKSTLGLQYSFWGQTLAKQIWSKLYLKQFAGNIYCIYIYLYCHTWIKSWGCFMQKEGFFLNPQQTCSQEINRTKWQTEPINNIQVVFCFWGVFL